MSTSPPAAAARFVILAAIDTSAHAERVIATAAALARATPGSELHIVHVVDPAVEADDVPFAEAYAEAMFRHREILEEHAKAAQDVAGVNVVGHLREGDPWRGIVQTSSSIDADLVVVGTHGRRGVARMVMGSVAEQVMRHAACPVLVVRAKEHGAQAVPDIEPPCPDCLKRQRETSGAQLWCARHAEHHPRAHLHYAGPEGFAIGSSIIRPS